MDSRPGLIHPGSASTEASCSFEKLAASMKAQPEGTSQPPAN